jgi:hypothetical protein
MLFTGQTGLLLVHGNGWLDLETACHGIMMWNLVLLFFFAQKVRPALLGVRVSLRNDHISK